MMRTGIALLNFGGPWTLGDVKPFLYRLFANPSVLVGVPAPFRQALAYAIAQAKGPSSIESYRSIGGGSPQLRWTEEQADGLRRLLAEDGSPNGRANGGGEVRVEIGMRSAEPSIESALARLKEWGARRVLLLPLFPHFSTTTTGTCLEEARAALSRLRWSPEVFEVNNWPDHPGYASLLRDTVDEAVALAERERGTAADPIHILFSAHSLPLKIVRRGDPYAEDVRRTVEAVTPGLRHRWSLCFQSRNGPVPWLEPYLEDELKRLGDEGVRRVVVAPISFVSDHVETLFELDQLYAGEARVHGITHYYRARSFNGDPRFAEVLRALVAESGVLGCGPEAVLLDPALLPAGCGSGPLIPETRVEVLS
ncbi:MAG TPA: ferrochelatase [Pyrinomonadaceae bacterium]|nr:ferrochelatase [Pyrinomonadaceae bacterium]